MQIYTLTYLRTKSISAQHTVLFNNRFWIVCEDAFHFLLFFHFWTKSNNPDWQLKYFFLNLAYLHSPVSWKLALELVADDLN